MLRNFFRISFILLIFFSPFLTLKAQTSNAGFIPSNIWYSKDPFQEGDKIQIYTLVYNPDGNTLTGTIYFFDNTLFLGNKDFSVSPKSSSNISIDWTATAGDHTIFAQIQNAKFILSNGKYETASLNEIKSDESKRTIAKTIIPDSNGVTNNNNTGDTSSSITNVIKNNTPTFVSKSIDSTVSTLEGIRNNISATSDQNKTKIQKQIDTLNKTTDTTNTTNSKNTKKVDIAKTNQINKNTTNPNPVLKPLMYVELFFLSVASFIFGSKLIFYGLILLIIFFILRYLWRLVF